MRRVDDPLVLPRAPGMRPSRAESDVEATGELEELTPPLGHGCGGLGKVFAATGADLDLGRDQLAHEMAFEVRALRGVEELLEAIDEAMRTRIEDRKLLLDRDGEIDAVVEALAGKADLLFGAEPLRLTHGAKVAERPRAPSSSAPPQPGALPPRGAATLRGGERGSPRASRRGRRRRPTRSSPGHGVWAHTRPRDPPPPRPGPNGERRGAGSHTQRPPPPPCRRPPERRTASRSRRPAARGGADDDARGDR